MQTTLDSEKLAHLHTVLSYWDIPPVTSVTALHEQATVFKITTTGDSFILKDISQAADLKRLAFTCNVLSHVKQSGLRVPLPLPSRSAQSAVDVGGQVYLLYEFIEADEYPSDPALKADLFYQTGQAVARLHGALASYQDREIERKTWRENFSGRVLEWISALSDGLPVSQADVVKRVGLERGTAIKSALLGLPEQLIHRDCHPGNVLVQGTRVVGFIDCDHICIGPRFFDLAYYAVHHLKWVTHDEAVTRRWLADLPHLLAGYCSQQALLPEELVALPYGMMAYHLLLAHWFMNLPRPEPIALEIRALDWLHLRFDEIVNAITSS